MHFDKAVTSVGHAPHPSLLQPPSPLELARAKQAAGDLVFLDSAIATNSSFSIVAEAPEEVLTGNLFEDAPKLREIMQQHRPRHVVDLGAPAGGLYGWIGFDGQYTLGRFARCHVYQHGTQSWLKTGDGSSDGRPGLLRAPAPIPVDALLPEFTPCMTQEDFCSRVRRAQEYITAGDIYQVNLSYPWSATWPEGLDPWRFYERLRKASPAPYSAYLNLAGTQVFSASPECFLKISGNHIVTRPIKGTRPRASEAIEDQFLAGELLNSPKERAELVMITDLERNDLGQVCEFGSVRVTELLKHERHAQVHHLVSTVEGTLRADVDHLAAFLACFPGGSISGAPKKRALEIIHELEPHPRGLYTGAIGCFGFNGESHFNIAIRTAWREGPQAVFNTGAGIVADSDPLREWEETRHKAAGLLLASR